jgi:hypothetical protein
MTAPKARIMKARGKREARRPWIQNQKALAALKGRHTISAFQALSRSIYRNQGRRACFAARLALAFILCAFGAGIFVRLRRRHIARLRRWCCPSTRAVIDI